MGLRLARWLHFGLGRHNHFQEISMIATLRKMLTIAALAIATQAAAQVTIYEHEGFQGRSFSTRQPVPNLEFHGFNDRASSIEVTGDRWEVCQAMRYAGPCMILRPGRYPSLAAMGLNDRLSSLRAIARDERVDDSRYAPLATDPHITFYDQEGFQGRSLTARPQDQIVNLEAQTNRYRVRSAIVTSELWEVCEDPGFTGRCVILRQGRYATPAQMGLRTEAASVRVVGTAVPIITFFEDEGFKGRAFVTRLDVENFSSFGFNDRARSAIVRKERWEVCDNAGFRGRCVVLREGRYATLAAMGLSDRVSSVRSVSADTRVDNDRYAPAARVAMLVFYEHENFQGRTFTMHQSNGNLRSVGFNDRASSVEVVGERWEACESAQYSGRCVILRPGWYPSFAAMGLNDRITSARILAPNVRIEEHRYAPAARATRAEWARDYRRRNNERLYEANVTSVRAVVGTPDRRCWVEREQVTVSERGPANVPGAVIGGIIGGILGHQVGGGSGKDIATIGGVVGGAVIGSNVGRDSPQVSTQDVRRCETVPSSARPDYWEVTYHFRGQDHRMQMSVPPGPTVTVNEQGEPRI
jgi:uncharacterized protein YcfJ